MLAKIYRHFVQPRLAFASAKARARKAGFVAFKVLAGNMEPTLTAGDIGCIKAFVYPNGAIARGQVIAYRSEVGLTAIRLVLRRSNASGELDLGDKHLIQCTPALVSQLRQQNWIEDVAFLAPTEA